MAGIEWQDGNSARTEWLALLPGRTGRNECLGARSVVTSLLERARADKLDPSIIGEDLLHRRGGAQRAAIPACERCSSFPRCDPCRTTGSYLQPRPIPGDNKRIVSSSMKVSCPRRRVIFSRRVSYVTGIALRYRIAKPDNSATALKSLSLSLFLDLSLGKTSPKSTLRDTLSLSLYESRDRRRNK